MTELENNLQSILNEKENKILPENIKERSTYIWCYRNIKRKRWYRGNSISKWNKWRNNI